jgi:putative ubiquitin-RnfH superfamily antitoxin RatB of RatAB toxin-antitoxin module
VKIEVVFAERDSQRTVVLDLAEGSTIGDAIAAAARIGGFPPLDFERTRCGVFGKLAGPETMLNDGDRVEIYRPLIVGAKDARRRRARKRRDTAARP